MICHRKTLIHNRKQSKNIVLLEGRMWTLSKVSWFSSLPELPLSVPMKWKEGSWQKCWDVELTQEMISSACGWEGNLRLHWLLDFGCHGDPWYFVRQFLVCKVLDKTKFKKGGKWQAKKFGMRLLFMGAMLMIHVDGTCMSCTWHVDICMLMCYLLVSFVHWSLDE